MIFELTRLDKAFHIFVDEDHAVGAFANKCICWQTFWQPNRHTSLLWRSLVGGGASAFGVWSDGSPLAYWPDKRSLDRPSPGGSDLF